jgi:carbamoyltransferase
MFILGVNTGPHDGSAALLLNGTLLVMAEQERLSRRKHAFGESPADAIAACLATAGITLDDVAEVAVGWDVPRLTTTEGLRFDAGQFDRWLFPPDMFPSPTRPPLRFVPHHLAHAASALWTSGTERAAILVIDGRGETQATTIAAGTPAGITILREWDIVQSIGHFYGFAAEWAGLSVWDAGKLMGLAAYGQPTQPVPLTPVPDGYEIAGHPEPDDRVPMHYFQLRSHLRRCFGAENYPYSAGVPEEPMAHADFAASVQRALEDVVFRLADMARKLTSSRHLVLAGGVGLNCTMNGRLAESGLFDDYYVPPVPHDAGVSLGAALLASREHANGHGFADTLPGERLDHAFWGPAHPPEEITSALSAAGLSGTRLTERELVSRVADLLADGCLVGWWQGRSEVGQRALGARSILCDPRHRHNLVRLNTLKGREVWRPLAPSVLAEYVPDLFGHKLPPAAEFMLSAWPVRSEARRLIPAAVHVDGSARPQVVRREVSPRYWAVINAFRQRTGVPAVVNTSFNLAGEPNVFSAEDAVSTFSRGGLDVLAIGDFLVENPKAAARPTASRSRLGPVLTFTPWQSAGEPARP